MKGSLCTPGTASRFRTGTDSRWQRRKRVCRSPFRPGTTAREDGARRLDDGTRETWAPAGRLRRFRHWKQPSAGGRTCDLFSGPHDPMTELMRRAQKSGGDYTMSMAYLLYLAGTGAGGGGSLRGRYFPGGAFASEACAGDADSVRKGP